MIRIVKIAKPVYPPDGPWRIYDETGDIDELIEPSGWLRDAMGARMTAYFKAERSVEEGWKFKARYKGPALYW